MAAPNTQDFAAAENLVIKNNENENVSTLVVQGIDTGWSGTVIVKGAIRGTTNFVPISYKRRELAGVASDDTTVNATITDTSFIIAIDCAGLDIQLVVTRSAGTLTLNWTAVVG